MAIPFIINDPVEHGVPQELYPGVVRLVASNPSPFTFTGSGTYFIGTKEVTLIDPGPDLDSHLAAILKHLEGRALRQILITHRHRDHAGLAKRLSEATGAPIAAHTASESKSNFKTVMAGLMDESFQSDLPVNTLLKDQMTIDTEAGPLTTLHTPGHTSDHCCFWLKDQDTLFTGDHVMGWSTTVIAPPEGDMAAYMRALKRLEALQPKRLIPTHGLPIEYGTAFLGALIDHRQTRENQVLHALKTGAKTLSEMVADLYPGLAAALVPAAKLSLLGHLDALLTEGRAALDGTEPLDHPFSLP